MTGLSLFARMNFSCRSALVPNRQILYNMQCFPWGCYAPEQRTRTKMPYAVLEKEIERLDETQQNTVALFVRFLLSQKAAAPIGDGETRPRRYDFSRVAGRLKLREDPVAFQRRIRDEWLALSPRHQCLHPASCRQSLPPQDGGGLRLSRDKRHKQT